MTSYRAGPLTSHTAYYRGLEDHQCDGFICVVVKTMVPFGSPKY